jgi:hypothetical protein
MLFVEMVSEARVTLPLTGAVQVTARVEPSYCQVLSMVDPVAPFVSFHHYATELNASGKYFELKVY